MGSKCLLSFRLRAFIRKYREHALLWRVVRGTCRLKSKFVAALHDRTGTNVADVGPRPIINLPLCKRWPCVRARLLMQISQRNAKLRRAGRIVVRLESNEKQKREKKRLAGSDRGAKWPWTARSVNSTEYMYSRDLFRWGHLNSGFITFCLFFLPLFVPSDSRIYPLPPFFFFHLSEDIYFPWNSEGIEVLVGSKQKNATNECVNTEDITFGSLSAPRHPILHTLEYEIKMERLIPVSLGKSDRVWLPFAQIKAS